MEQLNREGIKRQHNYKSFWRYALAGVLAVITLSAVAGCAVKEEKTVSVAEERQELVLWSYYEMESQKKSLDTLISNFNASQEKYLASWEYVPMTDFTKRISVGIMEGNLPDMVIIDNPDMKTYAKLGIFEDLTPYSELWSEEEEYYEEVRRSIEYDGKYYGVPFNCNNVALIYNTKMLKEMGVNPPATWEELKIAAKKLTTNDCYGFVMSCVETEQVAFQTLPWILSTGESIDTVGGLKTEKAFSFLQDLAKNAYLDINCVTWSQNDIARKFIAGEAAMMENGPWVLPLLEKSGISYDMVSLPIDKESAVIAGGENIGVIKEKNVEGAVAFLTYFNTGEVMKEVCQEANVLPPKRKQALELAASNTSYQVFAKQMETAKSRAGFKNWSVTSQKLSDAVYGIMTGTMTPKEAAKLVKG